MTDIVWAVVVYVGSMLTILALVFAWRVIDSCGVMDDHEHVDED